MLGKLALPAIRELIELGDENTLREALNRWLPADLAELVDALAAARSRADTAPDPAQAGGRDYRIPRSGHPADGLDDASRRTSPDSSSTRWPRTIGRPCWPSCRRSRPSNSSTCSTRRAAGRPGPARIPRGQRRPADDSRLPGRAAGNGRSATCSTTSGVTAATVRPERHLHHRRSTTSWSTTCGSARSCWPRCTPTSPT